jgi:glycosyltransferase 2 family protein
MHRKIKNILTFLLRFGLSAALIFFLLRKIDFAQVFQLMKHADGHYLALAAVIFLLCNALLLLRWDLIIKGLDVDVPLRRVVISFFVGLFFNIFLPSSAGGDVARTIGLSQHTHHKARVITSVVLDRLSGFISLVLICGISMILGYSKVKDSSIPLILGSFLLLLVVLMMVLFSRKAFAQVSGIFRRAPHIMRKLMALSEAFVLFRQRYSVIAISIGISVIAQMLSFLMSYYIVKSFHVEVGMIYFLILIPIISLITSLPISLGGLGVRDASSVYFFREIGVKSSAALGLSLMNFVFLTAIGLIGGLIYVLTLYSGRLQRNQENP